MIDYSSAIEAVKLGDFFSYAAAEFTSTNRFAAQAEIGCAVKHMCETAGVDKKSAFAVVACAVAVKKGLAEQAQTAFQAIQSVGPSAVAESLITHLKASGHKGEADALHKVSINTGVRVAPGWN